MVAVVIILTFLTMIFVDLWTSGYVISGYVILVLVVLFIYLFLAKLSPNECAIVKGPWQKTFLQAERDTCIHCQHARLYS